MPPLSPGNHEVRHLQVSLLALHVSALPVVGETGKGLRRERIQEDPGVHRVGSGDQA